MAIFSEGNDVDLPIIINKEKNGESKVLDLLLSYNSQLNLDTHTKILQRLVLQAKLLYYPRSNIQVVILI
jgi:hypothetical protein